MSSSEKVTPQQKVPFPASEDRIQTGYASNGTAPDATPHRTPWYSRSRPHKRRGLPWRCYGQHVGDRLSATGGAVPDGADWPGRHPSAACSVGHVARALVSRFPAYPASFRRLIGHRWHGSVWRRWQPLGRRVAVKVLKGSFSLNPEFNRAVPRRGARTHGDVTIPGSPACPDYSRRKPDGTGRDRNRLPGDWSWSTASR